MFLSNKILVICGTLFLSIVLLRQLHTTSNSKLWTTSRLASRVRTNQAPIHNYEERGDFRRLHVQGFQNTGIPGGEYLGENLTCSTLAHSGEIGVQDSFYLRDDLIEIAGVLDSHPLVEYEDGVVNKDSGSFSLTKLVEASWDRLATACTFMPDYGVYLCVSRIIFHPAGRHDRVRISFLRGQIYSDSWLHLHGYRLKWKDEEIVFPKVFATSTEFEVGGHLYGPEDARIIIEDDVKGAEPVVVFNMITTKSDWKRAMWIFRPFSQHSTILTVRGQQERAKLEKNWAPFFVKNVTESADSLGEFRPSKYIHFVWRFEPFTVLKCHLTSGMCDIVFEQKVDKQFQSNHNDHDGSLRGGTQFLPVPISKTPVSSSRFFRPKSASNVQAFVAFPRTHLENAGGCRRAVYRPELVVLLTNTTHFYLSYGSGALDFGEGAIMDQAALLDPCTAGRIMITNSIARWDMNTQGAPESQVDVMTVTLSVDDVTVQVARMSGIWNLLRSIPALDPYFSQVSDPVRRFTDIAEIGDHENMAEILAVDPFIRASAVGWDVRGCLEEAALAYVDAHVNKGTQAKEAERKRLELIEQRKKEEEERNKAAEEAKEAKEKAEAEAEAAKKKKEDLGKVTTRGAR